MSEVPADPAVVVVGSANMDLVYHVGGLPGPGETVLATGSGRHPGGKGNNQVLAAARAGANAAFIGVVGTDEHGEYLVDNLRRAGVTCRVRRVDAATGTALIVVDDAAENTIVVSSGANNEWMPFDEDDNRAIAGAQVLLMQCEIPESVVVAAAELARAHGTMVVLNVAPFRPVPPELLALVDTLIVNEGEAEAMGEAGLAAVPTSIITRGSAGAVVNRRGHEPVTVPAPAVKAVDTTGAGDTFCGALAAALCEGRELISATHFAVTAGALAVQRHGAGTSIPMRAEIDAALAT